MTDRNANVVLTANTQQYNQQMTAAQQQTNQLTASVNQLTQAIDRISRNAGRKIELFGAGGLASIAGTTAAAAKLQTQLQQIEATATLSGRSMATYTRQLDGLRRGMAVTTEGAVQLFTQLNKMGQAAGSLRALSETMVRLSAVTGESIGGLTQGLIGLQRQMNVTGTEYTQRFASALANVSAKAGVSAQGVLDFSNAIAPIARVAGISTQQVMGFSAAFVKSGQDGYAAANAFNKMLTDITRSIQYGSPELKAYANLLGITTTQFANMPKAEAITQVFETISKQGPDAIKTLERFGLDGVRTIKAIQGVAGQSGGIRGAIADAMGGFNDQRGFQKASDVALQGFNDQLQILRNNLTATAQALGATFLPMATKVVQGMNIMGRAVGEVVGPVANLVSGLAALGSVGAVGVGLLVSHFTRLAAIGGIMQIARSLPAQGFKAGFSGGAGPEAATYLAGGGTGLQRAMFRAGAWTGNMLGSFRGAMGSSGPGMLSRLSTAGGWLVGQVGQFARYGLEPLYPSNMHNSFNRSSPFGEGIDRFNANVGGAASAARGAWAGARVSGMGVMESAGQAAAAARASLAMNSLAGATTAQRGLFGALAVETTKLVGAMARGSIGLGMGVGRVAGSGLRALGSGLMSLAGGPLGLAMIAGMGGMYLNSQIKGAGQDIRDADASKAAGNSYRVALGEAAFATKTFADVVKGAAGEVSSTLGTGYTDKNIQDMKSPGEAQRWYQATGNLLSDKDKTLLKADLTKRFGAAQANAIMSGSSTGADFGGVFGSITPQMLAGPLQNSFFTTSQTKRVATNARNAIAQQLGAASNPGDAAQIAVSAVNSARNAYKAANGEERAQGSIIDALLGGLGLSNSNENRQLVSSLLNAQTPQQVNEALMGQVYGSGGRKLGGINKGVAGSEAATNFASAYRSAANTSFGYTRYTPTAVAPSSPYSPFASFKGTAAYDLLSKGGYASGQVQNYLSQPGNVSNQYNAAMGLVTAMTQASGSTTKAIAELDKMAATIGDTNDPLFQLAQAASQAAMNQRAAASAGMGSLGAARMANEDLTGALALPDDASGVKAGKVQSAQQGVYGQQASLTQRFQQILMAYRELQVQMGRANADFAKSRARAEEDFGIQQTRNLRNYNIARQQAQEDFNLSRKRQEEDFNHSVVVMAEQAARSAYDAYQRVTVQQSWSGGNLAANLVDQNQRLAQQQQNLAAVRKLGLSGAAIQQLGLNEAQNAQQLARLVQDLMSDPSLIKKLNDATKARIDYGKKLVTDQDSLQWQEMQRSFKLSSERATQDFNKTMKRQQEQFAIATADMRADFAKNLQRQTEDFKLQMSRAQSDFNRSQIEITGSMNELGKKAIAALQGQAKAQLQTLLDTVNKGVTAVNQALQKASTGVGYIPGSGGTGGVLGPPVPATGGGSPAQNKILGKKILEQFGWGQYWSSFNSLVMGESGWRSDAQNPTSTAYGIGQFLNSTWATVGGSKTSDPAKQIYYMLKYIQQRYGNPTKAWNAWQSRSPHWYEAGSIFDGPQVIGVGEKGKEAVLPLNQRGVDFMMAVMKQYNTEARNATVSGREQMRVGTTIHQIHADYSTQITGAITVQAQDPDEMMRKIEAKKRRDRLVRPGK